MGVTSGRRPKGASGALPPDLELEIERLVLRGIAPVGRHRIAPAIQAELARLVAAHGLPGSLGGKARMPVRLDGGTFRVARNAKAEAIGETVARQLWAGWSGGAGGSGEGGD